MPLHQLHPLLVHAALFGGHYGARAGEAARRALTRRRLNRRFAASQRCLRARWHACARDRRLLRRCRQHVLVVDDDRAVRESLRRSLEFNGYEVSTATDGAEALAGISGINPDAVVMDVMMPRLDGLETTRALRKVGNDVPILVLTARDAVGDRVEGLDAGADDYLTKPFALEELLARLRALLRACRPGRRRPRASSWPSPT